MLRHPFTNSLPYPAFKLPAGRNTLSINRQICAMGVFRSQTPRALVSAFVSRSCRAYAFHLGRIRPFLYARIRAVFHSESLWYSCPDILQIAAIRCSHKIPFHCRIHLHSGFYPLIIHENFHTLSTVKSCIYPQIHGQQAVSAIFTVVT